jgi:hypothetical protein
MRRKVKSRFAVCASAAVLVLASGSLAGNGISLGSGTAVPGNGKSIAVRVTDVTGDGLPDLVLAGYDEPVVRVHPGQADSTFGSATSITTTSKFVDEIQVGRLNADTVDDLVINQRGTASVEVLLSDGAGGLTTTVYFAADGTNGTERPTLIDWDLDGDLDILTVASGATTKVRVRLNDGAGAFGSATTVTLSGATGGGDSTPFFMDVVADDFDGDGDTDLVTLGSSARVFWRQPDGSFAAGPSIIGPGAGGFALAADIDGDGLKDLVAIISNAVTSSIWTARHATATTFQSVTYLQVSGNVPPWGVVASDLNGDGLPELITGTSVFVNTGGTFPSPIEVPLPVPGGWGIAVQDIAGGAHAIVTTRYDRLQTGSFTESASVYVVSLTAPPAGTISPSTLFRGGNREFTITGSDIHAGVKVEIPSSVGVVVGTVTRDSDTSLRVGLTTQATAALGTQEAILRNTDGGQAAVPFTVVEGGVAGLDTVFPNAAHAGDTVEVTVSGSGFLADGGASLGEGTTVDSWTLLDARHVRLSVALDATATPGRRDVTITNGSGLATVLPAAFTVLRQRSLDVEVTKGVLRTSRRPGRGRFVASGTIAFNAATPDGRFDPAAEGAQIRFGDPASPIVVSMPPYLGWSVRGTRATWRSPAGPGPRVVLVVDLAKNTFRLSVTRADLRTPVGGEVLVELTLGDETGTTVQEFGQTGKRKYSVR